MQYLKLTLAVTGMLAAVIIAAPTEISTPETSAVNIGERTPQSQCGYYWKIEKDGRMPAYANGHYENIEGSTHMNSFDNDNCGVCMVFRERDAQGDILWSGGPGQGATDKVRGGQSYYCIDRSLPPRVGATDSDKVVSTRDPISPMRICGNYWDDRHQHPQDAFANGHYENVEINTVMWGFNNFDCGICMVFAGRDVQGDQLWWGGPGTSISKQVKGAQSYYCIYGDLPPKTNATGIVKAIATREIVLPSPFTTRETAVISSPIKNFTKTVCSKTNGLEKRDVFCGNYTAVIPGVEEQVFSIAANGNYENTIDHATMTSFSNQICGFCIVFKGPDCTGEEMYWGGPGDHTNNVKGAQSYFCY
ncbi:hypothetical protein HBI56_063520 [Parastagonospora nodorum]|nr:hypothetical protein HBH53_194350 [Parastagonospora nodorum]KAH3957368.1 hypothetical protein HBH51_225450 [Parastagonospora nodorum]KAH4050181.1 hypothetical protein HBH49_129220 [Parastagonospora nodorum]KAH4253158.1 hypothetical protein HBI03_200020 [Parastagonospora nodorum]KAH4277717.1 hypothetical protein HBI04_098040 [Parastagonospora nodorum]